MSKSDLTAAAHKQGIASLKDVERCVLEPTGTITFIEKKPSHEAERHDQLVCLLDQIRQDVAALQAECGGPGERNRPYGGACWRSKRREAADRSGLRSRPWITARPPSSAPTNPELRNIYARGRVRPVSSLAPRLLTGPASDTISAFDQLRINQPACPWVSWPPDGVLKYASDRNPQTAEHQGSPRVAKTKTEAIAELVNLLAGNGEVTDAKKVLDSVLEREATRTTGIGNGLAIPHGKCNGADHLVMAIGQPARRSTSRPSTAARQPDLAAGLPARQDRPPHPRPGPHQPADDDRQLPPGPRTPPRPRRDLRRHRAAGKCAVGGPSSVVRCQ